MQKILLTADGRKKLEDEIVRLEGTELREALQVMYDVRDQGNPEDNFEYDVAKNHYNEIQNRISKIRDNLRNSTIIDKTKLNGSVVQLLTTVRVYNTKMNKEQVLTIVPENEIDPKLGRISYNSPISRGLIGKSVGEEVEIDVPSGKMGFKILEITI